MLIGTRSTSRDVLFSLLQVTQVNKPKHCITSTLVALGVRCAVADDVLRNTIVVILRVRDVEMNHDDCSKDRDIWVSPVICECRRVVW